MTGKILVVDDELSLRMLISATLEGEDFEVFEAEDGMEAMKAISEQQPDLVILDVMMPGISGFEVCKKIKSNSLLKNIKIILLTAKTQQSDRNEAEQAGADYFLAKPFSPIELLNLVNNIFNN